MFGFLSYGWVLVLRLGSCLMVGFLSYDMDSCLMICLTFSVSLNQKSFGSCLVIKLSMSPKCLGPGPGPKAQAQGPGPRPGPKGPRPGLKGPGPRPTVGRTDGRAEILEKVTKSKRRAATFCSKRRACHLPIIFLRPVCEKKVVLRFLHV